MAVPLVVPDASVLLKWVLPSDDEPDADKALQLRAAILDDTVHVIVPPLWIYEVGNTVARRFPAHAQTWLSALLRFGLEEMPASQSCLACQVLGVDEPSRSFVLRCRLSRARAPSQRPVRYGRC